MRTIPAPLLENQADFSTGLSSELNKQKPPNFQE